MSINRSRCKLDDLPLEILSQIFALLGSKKIYEAGGDSQVFTTTCIDMIEGMGPKYLNDHSFIRTCALLNNIVVMFRQGIACCFYYGNFVLRLSLLRQAANEDHIEAIYLLGMIYISRGPHQCDEGLQLLDADFGWAIPDDGEYTGVVDSAKELLWAVDVVHRLITNNITFQCEDPRHSVKGAFATGYEEDENQQRYCTSMVGFVYFLKILMVDNRLDIKY
uniref:At2g35280-like TPR domain-containing protein n=1 Tax=Lactuca sativa TaxID=4236 RepID=A0A9R1W6W0_LACSA|nr:hypothetical protein LSAT_V11C300154370 [Lactuca sativa]